MDEEIQLELDLDDILEYVRSTLLYLTSEDTTELDKDDIVMCLKAVPETIQEIKEIIIKLKMRIWESENNE